MQATQLARAIRRGMNEKVYPNFSHLLPIFSAEETKLLRHKNLFSFLLSPPTKLVKRTIKPIANRIKLYLTIDIQAKLSALELDNLRLIEENLQMRQHLNLLHAKMDLLLAHSRMKEDV